ncbi:MAG TPA: ChaN family lipoprotein [Azospirillaceae bacterium]|nr:ChaN family lipoprotein [Azospirillaceae bacterium]
MRVLIALLFVLLALPTRADEPWRTWQSPVLRDHPLVGMLWDPATGHIMSPETMLERMAKAKYVLLGEKHDNVDAHRLQTWALDGLVRAGRKPAVVFEMITTSRTPELDSYLAANPRDAAGLGAALEWDKSGWPEWEQYRPIAQVALSAGLPLVAGNLPRETVRSLARNEPGVEPIKAKLGLDEPVDPALEKILAEEIRESHCRQLPESSIPGMVLAQRARDAAMAAAMVGAAATPGLDGAVLIAGGGHVRNDRGVPAYLRGTEPAAGVFAMGVIEVDAEQVDPAGYTSALGAERLPFDAVWFVPRTDNKDHCAQMAEQLKGR